MSRNAPQQHTREFPFAALVAGAVLVAFGAAAAVASGGGHAPAAAALPALPTVSAVPVRTDTLFLGGYARGTFAQAVGALASELSPGEREMVGRHLDKIFLPLLREEGLRAGGRLRLAYERTRRSDGSTRSIQVLAAQAAVGGRMHTVFFYETGEKPGYYDDLGRSLDPGSWSGPLGGMLRVTSPFRIDRLHPILRRVLPHTGIDYAAAYGTPVRATADGSVAFAGARGGYGNLVEVQHPNGYATRYAHLSRLAPGAHRGAPVRQGQVIGYVGASGLATGAHLHYEVRRKGQPVDPALVAAFDRPVDDVGYDLEWRNEKRALARLLGRAPRELSARRSPR
ncbi:MAG TPA: M23 family metallopeptidase [Longimicrobiaceae bacterium]|nr:M23 family metallopeptidase [Longimicrobiaceae bacterium]